VADVAFQRCAAAHRVEAHRDNAGHPRGDQNCGEERRVLQQHTDVWRPVRVQALAQRRRHRGAMAEMIAPVDERILEEDAPIVDISQRSQQVGDGGKLGCHS
jgi:hypothetical protein